MMKLSLRGIKKRNVLVAWPKRGLNWKKTRNFAKMFLVHVGPELEVGDTVTLSTVCDTAYKTPRHRLTTGYVNTSRIDTGTWWFRGPNAPKPGDKLRVVDVLPDDEPLD